MEATKIIKIMDKIDNLPYQKILFDGPWGIGKTKYITDSTKHKENIYYTSLFGKKNIDAFYQELYYLLLSTHEVKIKKVLDYMKNINFSHLGFSISIPLISDIFSDIQKQLKTKSKITIIIDDLERKNDDLGIKEIFGFIDAITKNKEIKIILVASSENFSIQEKNIFDDYAEKSIDRVYKITNYSKDAPKEIMSETIWPVIKEIYEENKLKNLRTLEKADLFIQEVIHEIPNTMFNNKFNKKDMYKICFSVVLFVIDHRCEMVLLTKKDDDNNSQFLNSYNTEANYPDYIWHYILKRNLNNSMMQNVIPTILKWFLTGDVSISQVSLLVKQIDTYVETKIPLFMSDTQILKELEHFSDFINQIDNDISIRDIIQRLDELALITESTNLELKYSVDEVVNWLYVNRDMSNNFSDFYFDNIVRRESNFINEVVSKLKILLKSEQRNQILKEMIINIEKRNFTNEDLERVTKFKLYFQNIKYENSVEKDYLINAMKNNKWFLPLPTGEITYSHWNYCHEIFNCISKIGYKEEDTLIKCAIKYFKQEIENNSDELFKYRINHLIKQYLLVD